MLDFFSSLLSYIEIIWSWFLNFIDTLLNFLTTLTTAVLLPPAIALNMWPPIATCVLAVAGFSTVKIILGRSNH